MLDSYIEQTRALLQVQIPAPATNLYANSVLTANINLARSRLAGEAQCIRNYATLAITSASRVYNFSSINTGVSATTGIAGVYNIRQAAIVVGDGQLPLYTRGFPWFQQYYLNEVVPTRGQPQKYAQYAQGVSGSIYIWPRPAEDDTYTLNLDCLCYPIDLVNDATVEAIPFPWTLCVPFLAAYYTLLSPQRQADAQLMMQRYQEYLAAARGMSNPAVLPYQSPQSPDPTAQNKLGVPGK